MSTEALVRQSAPSALVTFEGIDAGVLPITPENIELIQNQSKSTGEGATAGTFRNKETGAEVTKFLSVPISLFTNRVLFPPQLPGAPIALGAQPLCRSNDGVRPADNVVDKKSVLCGNCQYAQWSRKQGRAIKPPCGEKLIYTFAELETFKVFRFGAGGTNVSPLKKAIKSIRNEVSAANKQAQFKAKLKAASGVKLDEQEAVTLALGLDSFVIEMSINRISGSSGIYFTVNFKPKLANHSSPEIFREMYEEVKAGLKAAYAAPAVEDDQQYVEEATQFESETSADGTQPNEPIIEA